MSEVQQVRTSYDSMLMDSWKELIHNMKDNGKNTEIQDKKYENVKGKLNRLNNL